MKLESTYKILLLTLICILAGCEDFLDEQPLDSPAGSEFYSNETEVFMAVNAAYNLIDAGSTTSWHATYMSQLVHLGDAARIRWSNIVRGFRRGTMDPLNGDVGSYYEDHYKGIAVCNLTITGMEAARESMEASGDLDLWNSYRSEARVIRAWLYYNLLNKFGDIPFSEQQLATAAEYADLGRTDEDVVYDFIFSEIEEAAPLLDEQGSAPGRITRNTAYAVGAKAALFRAFFTNGQALSTPDQAYLQRVMDWTQAIIDSGVNELYYSTEDPANSYRELFSYAGENSAEVILQKEFNFAVGRGHQRPRILGSRNMPNAFAALAPTATLVHAYEDTLGNTVDQSTFFNPRDPYRGRDPRLYQTVILPRVDGDQLIEVTLNTESGPLVLKGYNEVWPGSVFPDAFNENLIRDYKSIQTVWEKPPGIDPDINYDNFHWWTDDQGVDHVVGNQDATNRFSSYTGLMTYKYMDFADFPDNGNTSSLNQMLIRYADVLLMNAEARIELNDNLALAAEYMNMVRARGYGMSPEAYAGHPSALNVAMGQDELRRRVRRERKVELAIEGWRWEDLKRYGATMKALNPIMVGRPKFYHLQDPSWIPQVDENAVVSLPWLEGLDPGDALFPYRVFGAGSSLNGYFPHYDLWPIPQGQFDNGNAFTDADQNPGYVGS